MNGGNIINFRKVTIGFVEVNPITDNKDVIHLFSEVIHLNLYFSPGLFVQKGTYFYGTGIRKRQPIFQKLECAAAIDDIVNNEDVFPFDREFDILRDFNDARAFHSRSITGQPDKIDIDRDLKITNKIRKEHKGSLQNTDQHELPIPVVSGYPLCQAFNDRSNLFP
jgi:hypothetical protein